MELAAKMSRIDQPPHTMFDLRLVGPPREKSPIFGFNCTFLKKKFLIINFLILSSLSNTFLGCWYCNYPLFNEINISNRR